MSTKTIIAACLMAFALGLAACEKVNSLDTDAITATLSEFRFNPAGWTVTSGHGVTLSITNDGAVQHEWVLLKKGMTATPPFDADDESKVFWEVEAQPGQTTTESFIAPGEPGTYEVVCGIPGHLEQGMQGTLTVE